MWGMEEIFRKFCDRNSKLFPEPFAQAGVILCATEEIAQQFAKCRAATRELDHSSRDRAAQKSAAKNQPHKARRNLQIRHKLRSQTGGITLRLAVHDRLREQIAGSKGVKEPLACNRIHAGRGVSRQRPIRPDDFAMTQRSEFRRRQHVTVKTSALRADFFLVYEIVEKSAQPGSRILRHRRANSHGQVIRSRKRPQIAVHAVQEFYFDRFLLSRNEIAECDFQVLRTQRSCIRQQLVSRACRKDGEIGGVFLSSGRERYVLGAGLYVSDARVYCSATRRNGTLEQQTIEHSPRINYQRTRHLKARPMPFAGNQFGGMNFLFVLRTVEQEGISFDRFVRQASSTRFLPRQMLIEERDAESSRGKLFAAERTGRAAADYGNLFHLVFTTAVE